MRRRASAAVAAVSSYEDMPFSIVLFRFLWPFWLFRDASRGDRMTRAAAYRHNRSMRVYLPGYLMKWLLSSTFVLGLTSAVDSLARSFTPTPAVLTLATAACAIAFACSLCVLFVTAYIYLYLSRNE
jgi:hypothetical protein